MTIRCIIVDDEQPARDELRYLLSDYADIDIISEADSAGKAISLIRETCPDLVFLDIQMPGRNGFDVIAELAGMSRMPLVVFATAYDSFAVKAFEKSAVDYIMKPFSRERLALTLERIRGLLQGSPQENDSVKDTLMELLSRMDPPRDNVRRVSVERNGRIQLLAPESIVFCSYDAGVISVHTRDEIFSLYSISTMDKLEDHLSGTSFFRAHRSVLINLDMICEFSPWFNGKYNLVMSDAANTELTISRARVRAFKQRVGL